ncbi:MAG: hypothetical protein ACW964_02265 [Candidatus Hodarchaeales archaeon]|jgi:hypothetical protein
MKLGGNLIEIGISIKLKKVVFQKTFEISSNNDLIDAIINMWAVAAMLETSIPIPEKIAAVRGLLNDENITRDIIRD